MRFMCEDQRLEYEKGAPSDPRRQGDRRNSHAGDEQIREQHAQRDMERRADERDVDPAASAEVPDERVPDEAQAIVWR